MSDLSGVELTRLAAEGVPRDTGRAVVAIVDHAPCLSRAHKPRGDLPQKVPMSDVVYRAEIPLTRVKGPLRVARLPMEPEPVRFGTHGAIARHYGIQGEVSDPHATTLDYIIAATGG